MPMGMADVATTLFARVLKFDPQKPDWPDRDRFVLSAGHGSMLLYAISFLAGYREMRIDDLRAFRKLGSRTPGHPERDCRIGVEATTGPLGQGLANAVGMALAESILRRRFGSGVVDHHTYVLVGDGCMMEGIGHEAISLAGHLRLNRLTVLFDDNRISIDGSTSLSTSEDHRAVVEACGWRCLRADALDPDSVHTALQEARGNDRPTLICCRSVIGYGCGFAGSARAHGSPLGADEVQGARKTLHWPHPPFVIPAEILRRWRSFGARGARERLAWEERVQALPEERRRTFVRALDRVVPDSVRRALETARRRTLGKSLATRAASGQVLDLVVPAWRNLLGGSADLSGSNNTKLSRHKVIEAGDHDGDYLHYGVREHAMAACMNGLALHGGFVPYGGTFLGFSDYFRPALRLCALMGLRCIFVATHDSIGLGEDGPTHQPVEHLASLRAIPGLQVLRPADGVETAECWEIALCSDKPTVLALSRQKTPALRTSCSTNLSARGGYILSEAPSNTRDLTLIATGSEVAVAKEVQGLLHRQEGISAVVVSMPSWELFAQQPREWRDAVLGKAPRVGIEAACALGWERWIGDQGLFIGMQGFGASGAASDLYAHFGFAPQAIVRRICGSFVFLRRAPES